MRVDVSVLLSYLRGSRLNMSYLDKLKQQAQVVKNQQKDLKDKQEQREEQFKQQVKPALETIQHYLQDLTEQLNIVQPNVRTKYKLSGFGEIDNLLQTNYEFTLLSDMDQLRQTNYLKQTQADPKIIEQAFSFSFTCKSDYPIRICRSKPREIPLQRDYLHKHGFQFRYEEQTQNGQFKRGLFLLRPHVSTKLIFQGNRQTCKIEMITVNFNHLGKQHYTINPSDVNPKFADELAKYIVREPHRLALHEVNTDLIKPKKPAKPTKPVQKMDKACLDKVKVKLSEPLEQDHDEFNQWLQQTKQNLEQQTTEPKPKKNSLFGLLKISG